MNVQTKKNKNPAGNIYLNQSKGFILGRTESPYPFGSSHRKNCAFPEKRNRPCQSDYEK